jgi:ATP-binding cassette, subfamily B (MDR/TAP), member 6
MISPCWIDFLSSTAILLAIFSITIYFLTTLNAPANTSEEQESLLQRNNPSTAFESSLNSYQQWTRTLALCILLTCSLDLLLDVYHSLHPEVNSITNAYLETHLVSSVFFFISWLINSTYLFFISIKDVKRFLGNERFSMWLHLERFWKLVLIVELIRLYHWVITLSGQSFKTSRLDIAFLCILMVRILAVSVLSIVSGFFRRLIEKLDFIERGVPAPQTWVDTFKKVRKLIPFLWPNSRKLQLLVVVCFILLILGRVVNLLVPMAYKELVDNLTEIQNDREHSHPFIWLPILAFTFFRFLQGGVGILSSLQYFLWIPVGQFTTREICIRMLEHLHSLSLQFHIGSKTGELLRVMDRGTSSIGSLLSYLAFNILPVFLDIGIAVGYFSLFFDSSIALIVLSTMILYIFFTVWITEWRTKFRREMNDLEASSRGRAVDSLMNFETVKYFGNEAWEVKEYEKAIKNYQVADWKSSSSLNLLNTSQNIVITIGLFIGLLLTAKRVQDHILKVGDFVLFLAYLLQLYQPLNWFGTYYRVIQQNFIDMEKMLELFDQDQSIKDSPNAKDLVLKEGRIVFDNVSFTYDRVPVIENLSFEVQPGKTVALVGSSGGGKSSILRVLFID